MGEKMKNEKKILKKVINFFQKKKEEWLKLYEGKFVVIKDEELLGAYDTEGEAYKNGLDKYGNIPFLIKKVQPEEPAEEIPAYMLGVIGGSL